MCKKQYLLLLKQIKEFWNYMGQQVIVRGKGEATFEDWINKDYSIQELIEKKYLRAESLDFTDFYHTRIKSKTNEEKIMYINNLIRDEGAINRTLLWSLHISLIDSSPLTPTTTW